MLNCPRGLSAPSIGIALVLLGGVAHAQSSSPAGAPPFADVAAKTAAKAHFEKGSALFKQEAWAQALAELDAAIRLYPTRVAMAAAAACLKQLGRYDEALDRYEEL